MKLSVRAKTIISVVLFAVIFATLITLATFFDFQVSELLTKNALPDGEYYANDFFGVFFECVGSLPIYLFAAFVCCVLFWVCVKVWKKKPYNIILAVVFAIGSVVAFWLGLKDSIGYIFDHVFAVTDPIYFTAIDDVYHSAPVVAIEVLFALLLAVCAIFATKHFNEDTLKKLFKLCITATVAVAVANLLIMIIKDPVGRMRFRAINSTVGQGLIEKGDVAGFTRWYVSNGQPNDGVINGFIDNYMASDAFKSFPSGHTCAAATVYAIMLVPDLFELKGKRDGLGAKIACWCVPIAITMLVAISRIVCGAHYMSDVTFGGTIAFVCMMISREIFICRGSHFFALFPMLKKKAVVVANENNQEKADEPSADLEQSAQNADVQESKENVESADIQESDESVEVEQNTQNAENADAAEEDVEEGSVENESTDVAESDDAIEA